MNLYEAALNDANFKKMWKTLEEFKKEFKEELAIIRKKHVCNRVKSLWDTWPMDKNCKDKNIRNMWINEENIWIDKERRPQIQYVDKLNVLIDGSKSARNKNER